MDARCPHCSTLYRLDPEKVPEEGVRALCMMCEGVFRLGAAAAGEGTGDEPEVAVVPVFHRASPDDEARRLARALVSDIVVYHPERRERSLQAGTLRSEFSTEIRRSWDAYVERVGEDLARKTPHFRAALNDILAGGRPVF